MRASPTAIVVLALGLTVLGQGAAAGQSVTKPPAWSGERITFVDGSVSFVPPPGFTPLSPAEFARYFPHSQGPPNAVGDSTRRTTIMYALEDGIAPSDDLEEGRKVFADSLNQTFQNPRWFVNAVRRIGARDWIVLEFAESVSPTPMRHIVIASVHRKQVLAFNLRSTVKDFPSVEQQLRAAMASIAVKP
jgi:hypothetical protein